MPGDDVVREIKFRGWNRNVMQMVDLKAITPLAVGYLPTDGLYLPFIDDLVLMQFTGLHDKNGKEIYEGDILNSPSWWWGPGFVYLNVGECGPCEGDSVMSYILSKDIGNPKSNAAHNIWDGNEVEVIGNIYESPERLEGATVHEGNRMRWEAK